MRIDIHRKMQQQEYLKPAGLNSRIINQVDEGPEDEGSEPEEDNHRGLRTEIAPPCNMDYFAPTHTAARDRTGFRSRDELAKAFNQGLDALRK